MTRAIIAPAALIFAALTLGVGCSPESKAKSTLEKYETAFRICKEETEKNHMKPGEHRCALITSMAVDMSLKDTGVEEAKGKQMLSDWLDKSGYRPYYIPPEKRAPENR